MPARTNATDVQRLTLTVEEAAELIGISRSQAYRCVRTGELRAVQLGRRLVIPVAAVEELLGASLVDGERRPLRDEPFAGETA